MRRLVSAVCVLSLFSIAALYPTPRSVTSRWDTIPNNGTVDEGGGTWSNASLFTYDNGGHNSGLVTGSVVAFGGGSTGTGGVVTASGTRPIDSLVFNTANGATPYTVAGTMPTRFRSLITVNDVKGASISAPLVGTVGVTKLGSGTLTLSGTNTYTGATTISAGKLTISSNSAASSPTYSIASGSTLEYAIATAGDHCDGVAVIYSGTGTLLKTGAGQVRWCGSSNFTLGAGSLIDVQAGTFDAGSGANDVWSSNLSSLNIASGATVAEMAYLPTQIDALTGAGSLQILSSAGAGPHDLTLGANNTAAGVYNSAGSATFSGGISGGGNLIKAGTGTQTLSGSNSFTGTATVSAGTLSISNTALDQIVTPAYVVASGGVLNFDVPSGSARISANNPTISGAGTVTKTGAATLFMANNGASKQANFDMSAGAYIDVQVGTMSSVGTTASNLASLNLATGTAATINDAGASNAIAYFDALSGAGSITINGATATRTLSVGNNNGTATFSGTVGNGPGTMAFTKAGGGTQTLSGTVNYTGNTAISGGVLRISASGGMNAGTYAGGIAFSNNGQFQYSSSSDQVLSGVISGAGSMLKDTSGTSTLSLTGSNSFTGGTTLSAGTLATTNNNSLGSSSGTTTLGDASTGASNITLTTNAGSLSQSSFTVANQGSGSVTLECTNQNAGIVGNIVLNRSTTFQSNYSGAGGCYFGAFNNTTVTSGNVGTLTVKALQSGLAYVPGNNTFVGTVQLPQGNVLTFHANSFGGSGNSVVMSGTVSLGFFNSDLTIGDLTGASGNTITLGSNTVTISSANSATFAGVISGTGGLTKGGIGTQTLSGVNSYTGTTAISGGVLQIAASGGLGGGTYAGDITFSNNSQFQYSSSADQTLSGVISGAGSMLKDTSGTSTLILTGNNTFDGGLTVSAGTVQLNSATSAGSGTVTLGDANTGSSNVAWLFPGGTTISNPVVVSNQGSGTVTISTQGSGFSTHTGTVNLGRATTFNDTTGDRTTFTGVISGSPGVITIGGIRVTFGNAANTFVGNLSISNGSIYQSDNATTLPTTTSVILNGNGTYRLNNGGTHTIDGLNGTSTDTVRIIAGGSATSSLGNNNGSGSFSGVIVNGSATLSLIKNGSGTQTLSGANTYTGGTTLNAGTLTAGNASAFGTGSITCSLSCTPATCVINKGGFTITNSIINPGNCTVNP